MANIPFFSVVTVCLNAGAALHMTIDSILSQSFNDFEIIIKDGFSSDQSLEGLPSDSHIKIIHQKDDGIYDAMNQALEYCNGQYINFLNAGDTYVDGGVLEHVASFASQHNRPDIIYTDYISNELAHVISYPDLLTRFYLYRRFICHQVQFMTKSTIENLNRFDLSYQFLADVDLLVKAILIFGYKACHCPIVSVAYLGNGCSERLDNRWTLNREILRIRRRYFGRWYLICEILRRSTFPGFRMWFLQHCKNDRVRKLYQLVADRFR